MLFVNTRINEITDVKRVGNSVLLALFFAETFVCGIINAFVQITNISVFVVAFLLLVSLVYNRFRINLSLNNCLTIIVVLTLFAISVVLNDDFASQYLIYFLVFGVSSFYFLSFSFYLKKTLSLLRVLFLAFLVVYLFVIRQGFLNSDKYWSQQMSMAFCFYTITAVSFVDFFFGRKAKVNNQQPKSILRYILLVFNIICSIYFLLVDCETRGAIFSLVLFALLLLVFASNKRFAIFVLVLIGLALLLFFNIETVLNSVMDFLQGMGIRIGALSKTVWKLQQTGSMLNGRDKIYGVAIDCIKSSPLFGMGIGGYEKAYNSVTGQFGYAHQFFLELICEYGFIGSFAIVLLLSRPVFSIFRGALSEKSDNQKLGFLFLVCSMPMLMFNNSYWLMPTFWIFFAWCMNEREKKKLFSRNLGYETQNIG